MSTDVSSHGSAVEGISDLLRCYICMDKLTKATLCPHCSKLGCFECIKRWVTDSRSDCPHCRNPLTMTDLIKIPLFDDLKSVLDSLQGSKSDGMSGGVVQEVTCSSHKEKMSVYCETCRECICHKCALWGSHHSHTLKPLDDFYKRHVEILQGELAKLNEHLKETVSQVKLVESVMETVKVNKSRTKREMNYMVEKKCFQLDETCRDRIEKLKKFREYLCTHAVEVTKESHDLEQMITGGSVSTLLNSSGDLKSDVSLRIQQLLSPSKKIDSLTAMSQFVNEVVPDYDHATFKMSSFREKQRQGKEIYSEPLKLQGLVWRLKVYPYGHKEEVGNYLAVFVELSEGYSRVANYQYCIEMLYGCSNKFPQRNYKKEYVSEFADGESWGYLKYYELALLQEDGFLKDDMVVLKFHVRPPTYYQKYQDQTLYLQKVMKERNALKQQVSSLKAENKTLQSENRSRAQLASSQAAPLQHSHAHMSLHGSQQQLHLSHQSHAYTQPRRERRPVGQVSPDKNGSRVHRPQYNHTSPGHSSEVAAVANSSHQDGIRVLATTEPSLASSQMVLRSTFLPQDFSREKRRKSADTAYERQEDGQRHSLKQHSKVRQEQSAVEDKFGGSQRWGGGGILNPEDIVIAFNDNEKNKSSSSSSTLVEEENASPPEVKKKPAPAMSQAAIDKQQQQEMLQVLSQEPFCPDDQKEMITITGLAQDHSAALPLSNYYEPYYSEQDNFPLPQVFKTDQGQAAFQGLSQPNSNTPPKICHGKSLTDLTSSNSNLTCSQPFLSQSMADFQHMQQRGVESSRHFTGSQQRLTPGYRNHPMAGNQSIQPGLQRSIIHALSDVREEGGASKNNYSRGRKGVASAHRGNGQSQPPRTHHHNGGSSLHNRHVNTTATVMVHKTNSHKKTGQASPSNKKRSGLNPLVETRLRNEGQSEELINTWEKIVKGSKTVTADTHREKDKDPKNVPPNSHHHDNIPPTQTATTLTPRAKSKSNSTSSLSLIL